MRQVKEDDPKKEEAVYLPHHAVIRNDKTTSQVRPVFNAAQQNKNGISLNSTLMVGPTLQADLRHTILRWRVHPIGLVADIIKMYRQVRIAEEDTMYQRIVWRDDPGKEIRDYELLTVTFGTASAPYLAVRCLNQVSYDEGHNYPLAADKVVKSFYMDDLMTGCNDLKEGVEIYKQMTELLAKGGFQLQKWNSNNTQLKEKIMEMQSKQQVQTNKDKTGQASKEKVGKDNLNEKKIEIKENNTTKILGLTWNREEDQFQYSVNLQTTASEPVTKRTVISEIARLFDPLSWIAPSIVLAKIFIQKLWLTGLGWDEPLNEELVQEWKTYHEQLSELRKIKIPRWLRTHPNDIISELHGFSDASKAAYSAVVYMRAINDTGNVHVSLIVARTRVAPIKQISIPRLELCGAVLLSKLLVETAEVMEIPKDNLKAWTDSTVVLAWLNSHPSRWKTFVGNRVSEILSLLKPSQWFHVVGKNNPADLPSRGALPTVLLEDPLWFSGPQFLHQKEINYNKPKDLSINLEETVKSHFTQTKDNSTLIEKFSSLQKLLRVVAYCRRFINKRKNITKYLRKKEIDDALTTCIKITQRQHFEEEYNKLKNKETKLTQNSKLKSLCPYLDDVGVIRISGRLHKSLLEDQAKHPMVFPKNAHLTKMLIAEAHQKTLHGGPTLMMSYLRTAYWIIGVRNLVKHHVLKCVICVKQRAKTSQQLMGSLPTVRCVPARPFLNSGVDYAGPINIRTTKGRGHRSFKGYICLFICMATRAVHLEVVSDMSTQTFLAAFRRFVSRRGHCAHIWSDNGTTFVGASKELQSFTSVQQNIAEHLEQAGTEWHFIPPHAPNFGGLWEAGVKSTKFHLKRVIGDSTLTYEEMSTLLCQVEACLNSRPMSVVNSLDPDEPLPLTPGHFLVGEPLLSADDNNYESSNVNSLARWQYVQRTLQVFWRRWSQEYLSALMNRYKWSSQTPEPKLGDVVLVKEDNMPPGRWLLGRIINKHPGTDNITRVITIKTKSSILKRATSKICVLPVAD